LQQHIHRLRIEELVPTGKSLPEEQLVQVILEHVHDNRRSSNLVEGIPPWKLVYLPLNPPKGKARFLCLFAYSHGIADGKSGLVLHKTFLEGLLISETSTRKSQNGTETHLETTEYRPLLPPIERAAKLSISSGYLLGPILGAYLPSFITAMLNLRASATPESSDQWRGKPLFHDLDDFHIGVRIISATDIILRRVLSQCKIHDCKLTGLLHQIVVRSLSERVPITKAGTFVAQSAVDLRGMVRQISDDDMALCVTGHYELHQRHDTAHWQG